MWAIVRWALVVIVCLYAWDTMRRIQGIPTEVTLLLFVFLCSAAFVLLFVGGAKFCWKVLVKEPEPAKGGGQQKGKGNGNGKGKNNKGKK